MTALTKNYPRNGKDHKLASYPVEAGAVIYQGSLVMITAAGYLKPCEDEAGSVFAGVSRSTVDNTGGANGAYECLVETEDAFEVASSGLSQANLNQEVFATDDNTVSLSAAGSEPSAGKIVQVISATLCMVLPNPNKLKA